VDLLDRARELLERDHAGDPRFVARMLLELSDHYSAFVDFPTVISVLRRASELARMSGEAGVLAEAECRLAVTPGVEIVASEARAQIERATRWLDTARDAASRPRIQCMLAEAQIVEQEGQIDSAMVLSERALSMAVAAGDTASVAYADLLGALGQRLIAQNRWREALAATRRRIDALSRIGRGRLLPALRARLDEATALVHFGEFLAADSAFVALLPLAQSVDSNFVETYVALPLALLDLWLDRPDSAATYFRRSMALAVQRGEKERYLWALERLAATEAQAGALSRSRAHLRELGRQPSPLIRARIAEAEGHPAEALQQYREVIASLRISSGRFPPGQRVVGSHRIPTEAAHAALAAGDATAADSLARHGVRLAQALQQEDARSADIGAALLMGARARLAMADTALARDLAAKAVPGLENGLGADHTLSRQARELVVRLRAD
jgi:tetratricopeptide (TPR) repeat protein